MGVHVTRDQRIELLISSTATLVAQLTELKIMEEQLRQAREAVIPQTLAQASKLKGFETAKYHQGTWLPFPEKR